jgi:hypothetical protein
MTLEDKLRAAKTNGEFADILNKANGVKTVHYSIKPNKYYKEEKTEWDTKYIFNGTQQIGWVMFSGERIPFVVITAKRHTLDKHALAVAIKELVPDSWGEYLYFNKEHVRFDDLQDKEFLANMDKEFEKAEKLRDEKTK